MPRAKLYFPHRIPEPKRLPAGEARMGELELKVFERESKKNYRQDIFSKKQGIVIRIW